MCSMRAPYGKKTLFCGALCTPEQFKLEGRELNLYNTLEKESQDNKSMQLVRVEFESQPLCTLIARSQNPRTVAGIPNDKNRN